MSDSLKNRLSDHSNSFEGLLSLIPARYYYEDDSSTQWKKGGADASERKAESANARKKKFDPEVGSSALDVIKQRERSLAEGETTRTAREAGTARASGAKAGGKKRGKVENGSAVSAGTNKELEDDDDADDDDDDDVIIYDDHGNPVGATQEESIDELLRLKALEPSEALGGPAASDKNGVSPAETPAKTNTNGKPDTKAKAKQARQLASASSEVESAGEAAGKPAAKRAAASPSPGAHEAKRSKPEVDGAAAEESEAAAPAVAAGEGSAPKKSRQGIEELRARLAARVNELRAKRKAPGSTAEGAPKNREELLAARKQRLEQKKAQQREQQALRRGRADDDDNDDDDDDDDEADDDDDETVGSSCGSDEHDAELMFGQVAFGDGTRLGKDLQSLEEQRKLKKRNATDQLKVLESRKAKLGKLDKEKQAEIAEKARWSRVILQSEGAKIRDDEKLLRKTIKQKENRKKRSEKEWKQRIYNVKKGISDREAKRHANISAHKEAKKLRLKGKKRRQHMKNAAKNS